MSVQTYFIANGPATLGTHIKIGRSEKVDDRLAQLQTASSVPLFLLACISGDKEKIFHERFKADRLNGEWFAWTYDMQHFIDRGCYDFESDLIKLLHSYDFKSSYAIGCPLCRFEYAHFDSPPEVNDGNYPARTTQQVRIRMDGECGHVWYLILECCKGIAQLRVSL